MEMKIVDDELSFKPECYAHFKLVCREFHVEQLKKHLNYLTSLRKTFNNPDGELPTNKNEVLPAMDKVIMAINGALEFNIKRAEDLRDEWKSLEKNWEEIERKKKQRARHG